MGRYWWRRGEGPLSAFGAGFEQHLQVLGHRPGGVRGHLALMGELNWWLASQGIGTGELSAPVAQRFLDACRGEERRRVATMASLAPLLTYLRAQGAAPALSPAPVTARDELLTRYRCHLVQDRGLAATTVLRYERFARRFLAERAARTGTEIGAEGLTSADVNGYLLSVGSRLVVTSAKREAGDLRALLRFLFRDGVLDSDLGAAMPPVAVWRGAGLPSTVTAAAVQALVEGCDRSTVSGLRDRAILLLLARLGLRSGEVAALRLADVDWRAGEILVRGKARRHDRLPLPVEVGEALVDYLTGGRPACRCPELVLTLYAPPRAIHPSSLTRVVYRACRRAGLPPVGGHRLRHALAGEMLRHGGNLIEIAQVLRQSDLGTTSGYAKLDQTALRVVARPWPGTNR